MSRLALRSVCSLVLASIFASSAALAQDAAAPEPPVAPAAADPVVPVATPSLAPPASPVPTSPGSVTAVATDAIPARADGRAIGACGTESIGGLAGKVNPAMVEVAGSYVWAVGFAFEEPDLIVAPAAVASKGRGVEVTYEGRTMPATIAAVDEKAGIAILRVPGLHVDRPLTASPLEVQLGTATVGPTFAFGEYGEMSKQMSDGAVTAVDGARFKAAPHAGLGYHWGAPIVDCGGRVLGMSDWYGADIAGIAGAKSLMTRVRGGAPAYEGAWTFEHPTFHALLEIDQNTEAWGGIDLGFAVVAYDRLELGFTGRVLGRGDPEADATDSWSYREWGVRGGADLRAGYRLMLTEGAMPFYLVPHLGAGFDVTYRGADRTRQRALTSDCDADGSCPVITETDDLPTDTRARVYPAAGIGARLGFVELDYTFRLDVAEPKLSSHQIGLGIQF